MDSLGTYKSLLLFNTIPVQKIVQNSDPWWLHLPQRAFCCFSLILLVFQPNSVADNGNLTCLFVVDYDICLFNT